MATSHEIIARMLERRSAQVIDLKAEAARRAKEQANAVKTEAKRSRIQEEYQRVWDFLQQLPVTLETEDRRAWRAAGHAFLAKCLDLSVPTVSLRLRGLQEHGHLLIRRFDTPQTTHPMTHVSLPQDGCDK